MGFGVKTRLLQWYYMVFRYRLPALRRRLFGDTSQHGEYLVLRKLVGSSCPRWIVDVGANDGERNSNSFPFIAQGWSGVLIEPNPAVFARLKARYDGNDRVRLLNNACARTPGAMPLFLGKDGDIGEYATLSTENSEYYRETRTNRSVEVRVERLTTLLDSVDCPPDIGILSVDTEGFDYEVLASLDWRRFQPRFVITEDANPDDEQKFELLRSQGYTFRRRFTRNSVWERQTTPG